MTIYPYSIQVQSLSQLGKGQDWRLQLPHSHPAHLLIWTTRGQGRVLLDGQRRGLGTHNALWLPAGHLFSLELGYQGAGNVVIIPDGASLRLPETARHLRIREATSQSDLNMLIEGTQREEQAAQPLRQDALEAHAALMSVWLRRQIIQDQHVPNRPNAAARLSARFCALVADRYASGVPMADYADALDVTPTHLTRAVRAATGKTAATLLTERVLHAARSLLADTSEPVQNIARHLGFGSPAYFTRFIQQHTGQTPSGLRG